MHWETLKKNLEHPRPPDEVQVDFGYALVKMGGILRKVCFFVMALPYFGCVLR